MSWIDQSSSFKSYFSVSKRTNLKRTWCEEISCEVRIEFELNLIVLYKLFSEFLNFLLVKCSLICKVSTPLLILLLSGLGLGGFRPVLSKEGTGCPKKNALLSLKAYNSCLEATIGTSRDSFGILRLSAFIWDQEVQDYVKASLRKTRLKLATLSQNLTLLYHRYSLLIKNVLQCLC